MTGSNSILEDLTGKNASY